jgi:hypothetical protein
VIEKPVIIITSLGRTGTKFFQILFRDVVSDSTALHEPDYLNFGQYQGVRRKIDRLIEQVEEAGSYNLIIKKVLGRWSLVKLSDDRFRGEVCYRRSAQRLLNQREDFIDSQNGSVYVESSSAYRGLIDVLKSVYENHRVVYIIRDGRDWVRSKMNFGKIYAKGKLRGIVSHTWPTALEIENDSYRSKWNSISRFERICWAWSRLNKYALKTVQENPNARVFRFEDIFKSENRYQHLAELVNFATDMPGVDPVPAEALDGWLDRKIHKSSGDFPAWPEWSTQQKQQFTEICGPLMEELGYAID